MIVFAPEHRLVNMGIRTPWVLRDTGRMRVGWWVCSCGKTAEYLGTHVSEDMLRQRYQDHAR